MPYDEKYGFAPRCFDDSDMTYGTTLVRRLISDISAREELKNEMNLFYVACTRAMCRLHIMAQEARPFDRGGTSSASSYSELFDISAFSPEVMPPLQEFGREEKQKLISRPDENVKTAIEERFMREYAFANSVNLPVKSSASALMRMAEDEAYYRPRELFTGEEETGAERGIAYHRFLELCDFSVKDIVGITAELKEFLDSGRISRGQFDILDANHIKKILCSPVFEGLAEGVVYREREFLCRLPANEVLDTDARDGILLQGAIDLLAQTDRGYRIIDYKYSSKSDERLKDRYSRQLALYKKAVSVIMKVAESSIETAIVNIFTGSYIEL